MLSDGCDGRATRVLNLRFGRGVTRALRLACPKVVHGINSKVAPPTARWPPISLMQARCASPSSAVASSQVSIAGICGLAGRSSELRQPRAGESRGVRRRFRRQLWRLSRGHRRSAGRRGRRRGAAAVPPRSHAAGAGRREARARREARVPADGRLRDGVERTRAGRVVLVGENDHYKPLAVTLRKLLADGAIGDMVFAHFTTIAQRLKTAGRLAQRRGDGRRRRVLRGRASTGCTSPAASARRSSSDPRLPAVGVARRARSRAPRA